MIRKTHKDTRNIEIKSKDAENIFTITNQGKSVKIT